MTYQVLARKWRPQAFDTVVGQEPVTRTLQNALLSGRVAHAYLFTGPRGVGKTTTARLLAKALCCTVREGAEACGACPSCVDFVSGAPVDVMEIDAASNTSVDDIRTLRENVKYAPARGRFKVYIVDEVHMLSGAAFNAFLKTLEEPPAHVVFVLATTDPKKIPATVLSRCQRFDFKPIAPDALTSSLAAILETEGVPFEPAALPLLVRAAEGSLRDALSLLDTAIAYGEGQLTEAGVAQLLGSSSPAHVRAFVEALLVRDGGTALEAIDRAAAAGEDLLNLCRDVVEVARRLLVLKAAPGTSVPDLTPAEAESLRAASDGVSIDELVYLLRAFLDADAEMRRSPYPRVELEIAAVRSTRRPAPKTLDSLLEKVEDALGKLRGSGGAPTPAGRAAAAQEMLLPGPTASAPRPTRPASPASPLPPAGAPVSPRGRVDASREPGAASSSDGFRQAAAPPASDVRGPAPRAADVERTVAVEDARPPESGPERAAGWTREEIPPGASDRRRGQQDPPDASQRPSLATEASGMEEPTWERGDADEHRGAAPPANLEEAWERVVAEVMRKKALLGTVLQGAVPQGIVDGTLVLSLTGNHFHKEQLAIRGNRDIVNQVVQQLMPGVKRVDLDGAPADAAGGPRNHPAVQAALSAFQGEVVAVRPRAPREGDAT